MKGKKLCYGLLLVCCTIFLSFSNGFSVFAETKDYQNFALRFRYYNGSEYVSQSMLYNDPKFNVRYVDRTAAAISSVTVPSGANFMSVTAKYNLVAFTDSGNRSDLPYNNATDPFVYEASINNVMKNFENSSVIVHQTDWVCDPLNSGITTWCRTFTYEVSFVIRDIPASITKISWGVEYPGRLQTNYSYGANYYFEGTPDNRAVIGFSFDYESALLEQQNQLIMIGNQSLSNIDQGITNLYNQNQQYYNQQNDRDQQDRDDLEDASDDASADASSAQSQAQTTGTTLLRAFTDFVTAVTNASASNCIIDADMGNLDLGEIDLCQLALPAPFQVLASLTVIGFCVPLSIATAKKLIALIRSFQ